MHSLTRHDFQTGAAVTGQDDISSNELRILRDLLQLLPAGVTVQDEQGELILVNEAAASQLQLAASASQPSSVDERHAANLDLLRSGHPVVLEEVLSCGASKYVFLTSHRPVRIAGRNLLISTSTDISEQKAFEDQLFRSAYYDELTGLPTRRVIEHRVSGLIRDDSQSHFALAFLDVDNFKHINDYYGHAIGDALLVELSKRLGHALRETDILSRISGDEFLLLLNPISGNDEVAEFIQVMQERLKAPFFIEDSEIFASTSIGVSSIPCMAGATRRCARTPTSRCTASRTTARARPRSSTTAWSARRWRG